MVGQRPLEAFIGVRIPARQLTNEVRRMPGGSVGRFRQGLEKLLSIFLSPAKEKAKRCTDSVRIESLPGSTERSVVLTGASKLLRLRQGLERRSHVALRQASPGRSHL